MIYDPEFSINEEAIFSKDNKNPIYIVLSSGSSPLAKAIKKVTKSEFSHAMISFNSKLDPLYSFGTKAGGKGLGFVINNPKDVVWNIDDCKYSVYVMYVNDKAYNLMKNRLKFFTDNKDKLKYDFRGLIDIWRGIESDTRTQKWFCSRFVMEIINSALPLSKAPSLWKPVDILNLDNISLVNRGFNFYNYNYKVTERHCNDIKKGKYNVGDVIYEGISSTVVKDYSSKRDMFLSNFTRMKLSDAVIQTYKAKYPSLSHVRINKNTKGYCWLDEDKLVATINTEIKDDDYVWINAFEIFGEYKGHGLSKQILRFAIKDLNITHLSVNKKNEVAIKLYKSLGFNTYRESENMLFMSIHSKINESSDAVSTVILQESDIDDYKKYIVNGSEYYLEIMYEKMYKQYHYKTPLVGFPTDSRKEYLEFEADTIAAANNYYTFKISDANKDYPFKFFNILDIPKNKYMELINEHVPMTKRKDANLYHVNIVDNKRKISTILVAIPNTIYATYLLLPNNVLYKFDHEGKLYQEAAFYSNDYRESAVLAVDKLKQLHDNHKMMNINTIDIVHDDGKWIFAEYNIDNETDKDNVVRFTNFINQIIKTSIYEGCIEPPTNYKSHGFLSISEKSIYDMVQTEGTKFYKNPAQQLKKKNTIKKNDQIKKGKYSVQTLPEKNKNESSDVNDDIESVAEYARKLLTKEIFECKDCAYVYKDIMKPYAKDNSFAVIGWDSNSLKADDVNSFDKCRNAVYDYCKKIFEDVKKDYTLEADDACFYVCKK